MVKNLPANAEAARDVGLIPGLGRSPGAGKGKPFQYYYLENSMDRGLESYIKRTGMGEFNSDDHYIYYCGQESLRRNGVAIMVNKRI